MNFMKYYFCPFLMIVGILLMTSSFPPAMAEIIKESAQHDGFDISTQANQIKMLIGLIVLLFAGNMFWLRKLVTSNDIHHSNHYQAAASMRSELDGLVGEHRMSMQMRGCAADPESIKKVIEDSMIPILKQYHLHQREDDNTVDKSVKRSSCVVQENAQGDLFHSTGTY